MKHLIKNYPICTAYFTLCLWVTLVVLIATEVRH